MPFADENHKDSRSCGERTWSFVAGETIFEDDPYAWIVDKSHLKTTCSYCIKQSTNISCSRCEQINYCTEACKTADEPYHRLECKVLCKYTKPSVFPCAEIRLVIRVLDRSTREYDQQQEQIGDFFGHKRTIHDLLTHLEDLSEKALAEVTTRAKLIFDLLEEHLTAVDEHQILVMLQKCRINSHGLIQHDSAKRTLLGRVLYLAASKLNHSCVTPTGYVQIFDGRKYNLRALQDLLIEDPLSLTINYVPSTRSYTDRQALLKSHYHFACSCPKCLEQAEQSSDDITVDTRIAAQIDQILYIDGDSWSPTKLLETCSSYLHELDGLPDSAFYMNQLLTRTQQACHDLGRFADSIRYGVRVLLSSESMQNRQSCLFYLCMAFSALGSSNPKHRYHSVFCKTCQLTRHLYELTHGPKHQLVAAIDELNK